MQTQSEKVFDESDILPIIQPSLDLKIDPAGVDTKIADERVSVDAKLALKPDITNVLTKDNTTAYTPTADYHPATKYHAEHVDKYTRAEVDSGIAALANTRLSTVASAVVLDGQVALENAVVTKNFEAVAYTGTGAALDITTGLNTCDFTVPGNGSGYYNKRVGNTFAVVADNAVDLIDSTNDTSDVSNWTVSNNSNLSSDGNILSISYIDTSYYGAISADIPVVSGQSYFVSLSISGVAVSRLYTSDGSAMLLEFLANSGSVVTIPDGVTAVYFNTFCNVSGDNGTITISNLSILPIEVSGRTDWSTYNSTSGETPRGLCRVHVKSRSTTAWNSVWDSLRGGSYRISTNNTQSEDFRSGFMNVSSDGLSITSSDANSNTDQELYVCYQDHFCTHVRWGVTNQRMKYVEAYNPATKEYIEIYEGSGLAEHEIPHSLGAMHSWVDIKCLSTATDWDSWDENSYRYVINTDAAALVSDSNSSDRFFNLVNDGAVRNAFGKLYVMYGKAKSKTFTIVEYYGNGLSNHFIETRDVFGIARKPAKVTLKGVSGTNAISGWSVMDNRRTAQDSILLNLPDAELNVAEVYFEDGGFRHGAFTDNVNSWNRPDTKYIAMVEFDTNSDGGGSYYPMPVDDSNLLLTDVVFSYTDGKDGNGFARKTETVALGSVDFAGVADGLKWLCKEYGGGYQYRDLKPSYGIYNKQFADDNRDVFDIESGKWISTVGEELVTNGTFDADTSGWTAGADTILSVSNSRLVVAQTTNDVAYAYQAISCIPGVTYVVAAEGSGTSPYIQVNEALGYLTIDGTQVGVYAAQEFTFVATNSTMYVHLVNWTSLDDSSSKFDNISVFKKQATLDTPLATPISFNKNPIYVASETPQYIDYNDELLVNQMESLNVGKVSVNELIVIDSFDLGQTWVDETANRDIGITYTNTTNKPIFIVASSLASGTDSEARLIIYINGSESGFSNSEITSTYARASLTSIIPSYATYRFETNGFGSFYKCMELK